MTSSNVSKEEAGFFDGDMDEPIVTRTPNVPIGNHTLKLLKREFKKAQKKGGIDRMELLFEVVDTDSKLRPGTKCTIPFFKDKDGFGAKGLAKLAGEVLGDPAERNPKEVLEVIDWIVGVAVECTAVVKMKGGEQLKNKNGDFILDYTFLQVSEEHN